MNGDHLLIGVISLILGITGLIIKADRYKIKRFSYTGHQLIWGTYILLLVGVAFIIASFF